jgi:hypothetical protein
MAAEMLLQYLWEHRLWEQCDLITTAGQAICVLDPGRRNTDAGPDFFNAKIQIGGHTWVGNVEIHVRASDWHRHHHDNDPAYDSVILHVVGTDDATITRADGQTIPQMVLPFTNDYRERYDSMVSNTAILPCVSDLAHIPPLYITDWITSLGYERLYDKVERIEQLRQRLDGDWAATAYVTLARALGFGINSEPFERLALATPLRILLKHRDDPALLEAALFGQSGFLDTVVDVGEDADYLRRLREDYAFIKAKYDLQPVNSPGWKMARMRPPNFPHRRIAALVALIADGFKFSRQFSHITDEASARELFKFNIQGYWVNHYTFGRPTAFAPKALSSDSETSLIINAVVPLMYAYALSFGNDSKLEAAVGLLQSLRPEINSVVSIFTDVGIPCDDAFTSQALIQLRRAYCEPRKCLYCRIGHRILAAKAKP